MIKDDGTVIYAFASAPAGRLERVYVSLLERLSRGSVRGRAVTSAERPYHDCPQSSLMTFARGLSTVVVLRKCCRVTRPALPGRAHHAGIGTVPSHVASGGPAGDPG